MLEPNQQVAACVPYTKRKKEWILARIERWDDTIKQYVVKDMYPDKRKKKDSWEVTVENVKKFPTPEAEKFHVGNRVLSLWLENEEWSSMFYEASVTAVEEEGVLQVCFDGDTKSYRVHRSKAIKLEEKRKVRGRKPNPVDPDLPSSKKLKREDSNEEDLLNNIRRTPDSSSPMHSSDSSGSPPYDDNDRPIAFFSGCSVLEKKMKNYYSMLAQRHENSRQATTLRI